MIRRSQFYVSEEGELTGCSVSSGVAVVSSLYRYPASSGGVSETIARFVDEVGDDVLMRAAMMPPFIDLRRGAPLAFFSAGSVLSSQIGFPTLKAIDFERDLLLLSLESPGGRYSGRFWVDLSKQRLVRSIVDGQETVLR